MVYAHTKLPVEKVVKSAKKSLSKWFRIISVIAAFIDSRTASSLSSLVFMCRSLLSKAHTVNWNGFSKFRLGNEN
jgi:hypothetical protein